MKKMCNVTDEIFNEAYENQDNKNIILCVLLKYEAYAPWDELERAGIIALWRCLEYHNPEHESQQKFTTSLYRFVKWECDKVIRATVRDQRQKDIDQYHLPTIERNVDSPCDIMGDTLMTDHVRTCLKNLPKNWQKKILYQYYYYGLTFEQIGEDWGFCKETARQRLNKAKRALRKTMVSAL